MTFCLDFEPTQTFQPEKKGRTKLFYIDKFFKKSSAIQFSRNYRKMNLINERVIKKQKTGNSEGKSNKGEKYTKFPQ